MPVLTLATWNINSLRLRVDLLDRLIADLNPDIICLQETKVPDALFPLEAAPARGYAHIHYAGMKSYNGVAILSRLPLTPTDAPNWCGKNDRRHIAATVSTPSGPLLIHNFYVPAGGDIPDPALNQKFAHKLAFVAEATNHFRTIPPTRTLLAGDLNIAPAEQDVWSHKQLQTVVSHTPIEVAALRNWQSQGFTDAVRHFVPESQRLYSWWSYRNQDWRRSDRGRRLDHIWCSKDLTSNLQAHATLKDARDWPRTSDHVPVAISVHV